MNKDKCLVFLFIIDIDYLGDFVVLVVIISADIGERRGGEIDTGDKVLVDTAISIGCLYPMCIKLAMWRNNNSQAVSTCNKMNHWFSRDFTFRN